MRPPVLILRNNNLVGSRPDKQQAIQYATELAADSPDMDFIVYEPVKRLSFVTNKTFKPNHEEYSE